MEAEWAQQGRSGCTLQQHFQETRKTCYGICYSKRMTPSSEILVGERGVKKKKVSHQLGIENNVQWQLCKQRSPERSQARSTSMWTSTGGWALPPSPQPLGGSGWSHQPAALSSARGRLGSWNKRIWEKKHFLSSYQPIDTHGFGTSDPEGR